MKKYIWCLFALMMAATVCVSLTACGDDEEDGDGLIGWWWSNPPGYDTANAIHFVNSSKVEVYFLVNKKSGEYSKAFNKKSGWYYSSPWTYTYSKSGSTILFQNGRKFTYTSGQLSEDGDYYSKMK